MAAAGLGDSGGYVGVADAEALRATGQYRVLTPDQMVSELSEQGPFAFVAFHPLMGGIPPEWPGTASISSSTRSFPGSDGRARPCVEAQFEICVSCNIFRESDVTHTGGNCMEFGLFIQGYTPNFRREVDPDAEHHALMDDLEVVQAADKAGFKYVWVTEHHFLDEYSHLSANDVVLGYLAHATERIHLGSGIFNPLPQVNHPAKVAERVAMLDHLSDGRFEFGTGRGAGSHEILGFLPGMTDLSGTREIWEDVIGEFPKMWMQDTYEGYEGKFWSLPPRKILPKPYGKLHPAMWYAAGNTSSYAMAARRGLGVLGFSVGSIDAAGPGAGGLQEGDRQRRAHRRLRQRQHHGDHGRLRGRGRQDGAASWATAPHSSYLGATSTATTTPSPTRRRSRCGPS